MDLIEAKISEVKNLNLIYVYNSDSILRNKSNKYVGAKVVYDKDKVLSLDYKNKYFGKFIKRLLERYNKEKDKRDIILLGDLTKQLVDESSFAILEEKEEFEQKLGIFVNPKKNQVKKYEKYLHKTLKMILKIIKEYEPVNINSIDGFNCKYVVNYSIGNINKQLFMLMFVNDENNLDFRITNIDDKIVNISGTIEDNLTNIVVKWIEQNQNIDTKVEYIPKENLVKENLSIDLQNVISKESNDLLLEDDENIINFYMNLCDLKIPKNMMKIDDNCYFLSEDKDIDKTESGVFYSNIGCQINIFQNEVFIKYSQKNGISKYDNQIQVALEENTKEFTLKKILIDENFYILFEKKHKKNKMTSYSYTVLSLNKDEKLNIPFDINDRHEIKEEIKSYDMAKQYIKVQRRDV